MRGKVSDTAYPSGAAGITPAHAGKRVNLSDYTLNTKDHPRPCGEKIASVAYMPVYLGSPPPMRGKDDATKITTFVGGITPAHAGKSRAAPLPRLIGEDHPRPCGEKNGNAGDSASS